METIELKLDEQNELIFKVVVEGAKDSDTKIRLVVEDADMSFTFPASNLGNGEVRVDMPPMKKMLSEGTYGAKLEVVAEDRFFEPLHFNVDLQNGIQVAVASVVQVNESKKKKKPIEVNATASLVETPRKERETIRARARKLDVVEENTKPVSVPKRKKGLSEDNVRKVIRDLIKSGDLEL
ncbi:MAG: hypothetical protein ACW96N_04355 [Candidatus Thorarchaeota archaeon]|jgi:hypothetical protein